MADFTHRFYVTGGTLPPDAPSYVERGADRALYDSLRRGKLCHVLTSRQMGKSSLTVRAAARLRSDGVRVAILDLTALGRNLTAEQWYRGLATLLAEQLRVEPELDELWAAHGHLGPLHRFMTALRRAAAEEWGPAGAAVPEHGTTRLVVFLDEIDAVRNLPFPADELFAAIRQWHNRRTGEPAARCLTFSLLGAASPTDLVRDPRLTPFNLSRRIELTDFTLEEAHPLAAGLLQPGHSPESALRLLRRVMYWTAGHPYLTQTLCQSVAAALAAGDPAPAVHRSPERLVDARVRELFLAREARRTEENLLFVHEEILRGSDDPAGTLGLLGRVLAGRRVPAAETSAGVRALLLAGVVRAGRSGLLVRNRIYARVFNRSWIRDHLPGAERRRQRQAFFQGVLRAAGVSALVLAVIGGLAVRAVNSERRAGELAARREQALADLRRVNRTLDAEREGSAMLAHQERATAARERAARRLFQQASRQASLLAARALAAEGQNRRRLADLLVQNGTRLAVEQQDLLGALPWFVEALRLDGAAPERALNHRLRIASVLARAPRLRLSLNTPDRVVQAVLSADGSRAVLRTLPGHVTVWDTATGRQLLRGGALAPLYLALDGDGRLLATASRRGEVQVWDARSGAAVGPPVAVGSFPRAIAMSSSGGRAAAIAGRSIHTWEVGAPGQRHRVLRPPFAPEALSFGAAGRRLLAWNGVAGFRIYDPATGGEVSPAAGPEQAAGAWLDPSGRWGLGRRWDLLVWNTATGAPHAFLAPGVRESRNGTPVWSFDPAGTRIAVGGDTGISVCTLADGRPCGPSIPQPFPPFWVGFMPRGDRLLSLTADGQVRAWNPATGTPVGAPARVEQNLVDACASRDGRYVLTTTGDRTVRLWELGPPTKRPELLYAPGWRVRPAFSGDGRWALIAAGLDAARLLALPGGTPRGPAFRPGAGLVSLHLSADGRRALAVGSGGRVVAWNPLSGRPASPPFAVSGTVVRAALSPDGTLAAFCRREGTAVVYDLRSGRPLKDGLVYNNHPADPTFSADSRQFVVGEHFWWRELNRWRSQRHGDSRARYAGFTPDGRLAVLGGQTGATWMWDLRSGRQIGKPLQHALEVTAVRFSADGRRVATASADGNARVWDVRDAAHHRPVTPPLSHADSVFGLAFSPDGRWLATLTSSGTVRVWDARTGELALLPVPVTEACDLVFAPDSRSVVLARRSGVLARIQLRPCSRPLGDLVRLARLLSGTSLQAGRGARPAAEDVLAGDWRAVGAGLPEVMGGRGEEDEERRRRAAASEERHDWPAAASDLEPLSRTFPEEPNLAHRLGLALAEQGLWRPAARAFELALGRGSDDRLGPYVFAVSAAAAGDWPAYRRACRIAAAYGASRGDDHSREIGAWTHVLGSGPLSEVSRAAARMEGLLREKPGDPGRMATLGALWLRAGQPARAEQLLLRAERTPGARLGLPERLLLAITLHRSGHRQEAVRELYACEGELRHRLRAGRPADLDWQGYAELLVLRREAAALIGPPAAAPR